MLVRQIDLQFEKITGNGDEDMLTIVEFMVAQKRTCSRTRITGNGLQIEKMPFNLTHKHITPVGNLLYSRIDTKWEVFKKETFWVESFEVYEFRGEFLASVRKRDIFLKLFSILVNGSNK